MEEEKETKFVKDVEVKILKIGMEMAQGVQDQIHKIIFTTDRGDITWKPKIEKISYVSGAIERKERVQMYVSDLPAKFLDWGQRLSEKGSLKAKISYTTMEVSQDGQKKTYRFITAEKTFDKWGIIEDKPIVEEEVKNE